MAEFIIPSFLEEQDTESVFERMLVNLPVDIDTSEGGHAYNILYPTAYETSYMSEFLLVEALKLIFPEFCGSYAEVMEYHAETRGLSRKEPEYATGEVFVEGENNCEVPEGTMFSTISTNGEASVDFVTTAGADLGDAGEAVIPIKAVMGGKVGNVPANTIVLNASRIDGISNVTNFAPTTGGIEEETIESLQERIMEYDANLSYSYGGAESDYKRWALSVEGTGSATIIAPTDDTGVIQIVIVDANGEPASETLCNAVYNYIMSPGDTSQRLAPVNDKISVVAPEICRITVSAIVELEEGGDINRVKEAFMTALKSKFPEFVDEGEIKFTQVGAILLELEEVNDYRRLLVNEIGANTTLEPGAVPSITAEDIVFTAGVV